LRIAGWLTLVALLSTAIPSGVVVERAALQGPGTVRMIALDELPLGRDWSSSAPPTHVLISFAYLEAGAVADTRVLRAVDLPTLGMMVMPPAPI